MLEGKNARPMQRTESGGNLQKSNLTFKFFLLRSLFLNIFSRSEKHHHKYFLGLQMGSLHKKAKEFEGGNPKTRRKTQVQSTRRFNSSETRTVKFTSHI